MAKGTSCAVHGHRADQDEHGPPRDTIGNDADALTGLLHCRHLRGTRTALYGESACALKLGAAVRLSIAD
jgi:hypothetical protein